MKERVRVKKMANIELVDTDELPLCPYCNEPLATILRKSKGWIARWVVYMCPNCKKLLGVGIDPGKLA